MQDQLTAKPNANGTQPRRGRDTPPAIDRDALADYREARNRSARFNRNLLQYGAAIASMVAVSSGTSALFALAKSLSETQEDKALLMTMLIGELAAVSFIVFVLILCLYSAFAKRGHAERDADRSLRTLIKSDTSGRIADIYMKAES